MSPSLLLLVLALCVGLLYRLLFARSSSSSSSSSKLPLPPSPPGEPLLGHFRIIPALNPEFAYIKWGKELNTDILYFNVLGRHVVVLNSVQAANDLLDKRGANYADRPRFVLFEQMGWGVTLTFLRYGPLFKLHRKLLQTAFTPAACKPYRAIQQSEAHRAAARILARPGAWERLANRYATAVVLRIGFGVRESDDDEDAFVAMADAANHATTNGGTPAASAVDYFPALRFLPSCLTPASSPLAHARASRPAIRALHDAPWAAAEARDREALARGEEEGGGGEERQQPSFMRTHLAALRREEQEAAAAGAKGGRSSGSNGSSEATLRVADIKGAAGAIAIAGGNTTWSTIVVCVLCMLLNPSAQRRAQAELDAVLSGDPPGVGGQPGGDSPPPPQPQPQRLPTFDDLPHLPHLQRCIEEVYRWAPLSPVGVPHAALREDSYKGYRIPAGAVVYANARAMTHDPATYTAPEKFDPDRYLPVEEGGRAEPLPTGQFGFGRRVCPGRHLATAGVEIFMATLLATMDVVHKVGEDGREIPVAVGLSNGLSSHPEHFECDFKPRSRRTEELLRSVA